jgi:heme A synthase
VDKSNGGDRARWPPRYSGTVSAVSIPAVRRRWLHRFSILLAVCTFLLFVTGAFVTSNEERPFYSLGQFHNIVAGTVSVLAAVLVIWLWREKTGGRLRTLAWIVLAAVIVVAVLGTQAGSQSPPLSAAHAFLAQLLFSTTVAIALFTSGGWNRDPQPAAERGPRSLSSLAAVTLALMFVQVAFGVALRQGLLGLALHILGAFLVVLLILALAVLVSQRPAHPALRLAASAAATFISVQALLGFTILTMQGSRLIDPVAMIVAAAVHTAVGALAFASAVVTALLIRRN